jgi:hypothetical protein
MTRKLEYKPLLLTTTMRNPERFRDFLLVLNEYSGKVLTNPLCEEICGELIRRGLYRPKKSVTPEMKAKWDSATWLTDKEVLILLRDNPQEHKEAGFEKGWPSRFDTQFKLGKFFGFIYYKIGEPLEFSKLGFLYIEQVTIKEQTSFKYDEQQVFLNAFVNYHRKNPYQRVLNRNKPLILLLGLLKELENQEELGSAGLYIHELPFLLIWKDSDAQSLTRTLIEFRKKYRFHPSREVVYEYVGKIHGGWSPTKDKIETITKEYPDDLLRKFRLTGLFSLRGNGSIISINNDLRSVSEYILKHHSEVRDFTSERDYYEHVSQVDTSLITQAKPPVLSSSIVDQELLMKWINEFSADTIKSELKILARNRTTTHPILRLSPAPLRLEFLTALLIKYRNPKSVVIANYSRDDEGLPISHAPGNNPDIELHTDAELSLYEVTMTTGTNQVRAEFAPITRHLDDKISEGKYDKNKIETILVAPAIHVDFVRWIEFVKFNEDKNMSSLTIDEFVNSD